MRSLMRLRRGTRAAKLLSLVPLAVLTTALACANRGAAGAGAPGATVAACAALPQALLESSPLEAPYEIERAAAVYRFLWTGRGTRRSPVARSGKIHTVLVTIHSPSWMTRDELDLRLQCHLAWMRSTERGALAMSSCPMGVPGTDAEVRMGFGQRFTIAIRSEKESAASEVWRRARVLAPAAQDASEEEPQMENAPGDEPHMH